MGFGERVRSPLLHAPSIPKDPMRKSKRALLVVLLSSLAGSAWGSDPVASKETSASSPATEIAVLRAQLAEQQRQIEQLRAALAEQQKAIDRLAQADPPEPVRDGRPSLGEVASLVPVVAT